MPYDPFDFDDGDGYALVPVDQAWPQVALMDDPNMRRFYELHPHETPPREGNPPRTRRRVPAVIIPGQRGGWRPGSGAPLNNTNAIKTGAHSKRLHQAARLVINTPELTRLIAGLVNATSQARTNRFRRSLEVAYEAALADPASRNSINRILQNGIQRRLTQIQNPNPTPKPTKNNQTTKAQRPHVRTAASAPSVTSHPPTRRHPTTPTP